MKIRKTEMDLFEINFLNNKNNQVDAILEYSKQAESKYFALQILEGTIQTRYGWSLSIFLSLLRQWNTESTVLFFPW